MNDHFVIFGQINADGSLLKLSPAEAYEQATRHVRPGQIYETYEIARADAIRHFAKKYLLGLDRARFLCFSAVSVVERAYARDLASFAVKDAMDALYGEREDENYDEGSVRGWDTRPDHGPDEEAEDHRIFRLYAAATIPSIPSATDLILDSHFA